jgi:hypothetical protein
MIVLGILRYGEEAYGSATEAVLKKLELTHYSGIRLALVAFAVRRTENVLFEAGLTKLTEKRKISNTTTRPKLMNMHQRPKTPKPQ